VLFITGQRFPSERELAEKNWALSRPTIREAMISLRIVSVIENPHGARHLRKTIQTPKSEPGTQ